VSDTGNDPPREMANDTVMCPHCGTRFPVPDSLMGGVVYCLSCGRRFQTPIGSAMQTPVLEQYARTGDRNADAPGTERDDSIIWRGRPSRWKRAGWYTLSVVLTGLGGMTAAWGWIGGPLATHPWLAAGMPYVSALLVITGILAAAVAEVRRLQYYYVIGKMELTASQGLLNIELSRILIRDIRSLNLRARFWERIVGICDVEIGTAGTSGIEMKLMAIPRRIGETLRHTRRT